MSNGIENTELVGQLPTTGHNTNAGNPDFLEPAGEVVIAQSELPNIENQTELAQAIAELRQRFGSAAFLAEAVKQEPEKLQVVMTQSPSSVNDTAKGSTDIGENSKAESTLRLHNDISPRLAPSQLKIASVFEDAANAINTTLSTLSDKEKGQIVAVFQGIKKVNDTFQSNIKRILNIENPESDVWMDKLKKKSGEYIRARCKVNGKIKDIYLQPTTPKRRSRYSR